MNLFNLELLSIPKIEDSENIFIQSNIVLANKIDVSDIDFIKQKINISEKIDLSKIDILDNNTINNLQNSKFTTLDVSNIIYSIIFTQNLKSKNKIKSSSSSGSSNFDLGDLTLDGSWEVIEVIYD